MAQPELDDELSNKNCTLNDRKYFIYKSFTAIDITNALLNELICMKLITKDMRVVKG